MKKSILAGLTAIMVCMAGSAAMAADQTVALQGHNDQDLGTVEIHFTTDGAALKVDAKALSQGWHRVYVHDVGDCSDLVTVVEPMKLQVERVDNDLARAERDAGGQAGVYAVENGSADGQFLVRGLQESALMDKDGSAVMLYNVGDQNVETAVACGVIYPPKP
ncbi:MAG: superoxide dismutase family protein [Alphaproteobacteria bacterium]|nr:superoxide dismutase family protein [Alphaproteobacteria bacterium]MBU0858836.1 superoxide dismutase family protein [Alphaproteobacteria bacterium]